MLLQLGAGVGSFALLVETAFVANGDGAVVVAYGMDALDTLGQNGDDGAVALNVIVVRGLAEALVAGIDQSGNCKRLVAAGTGAVKHEVLHVLWG